eukprot:TRINITY_DN3230_c0_g2_i2.p1 TRINITY_DN3230_c0_g2~~TRINITY_DN3230_c0_g2_i2.p1  ORF type:complete len:574 (-),score=118.61 TRINITY_DN3230_c0_g2_i2:28-1536(-)
MDKCFVTTFTKDFLDAKQRSGLHFAASLGKNTIVHDLLRQNCNLESRDASGATPLFWAVWGSHSHTAISLLKNGADVNARNNDGIALIHIAALEGTEILSLLIDLDADIHAKTINGETALFFAAAAGNLEAVNLLILSGCDPKVTNKQGETCLHWAALEDAFDVSDALILQGCSIDVADTDGVTVAKLLSTLHITDNSNEVKTEFDVNDIIRKLLEFKDIKHKPVNLKEEEIKWLCNSSRKLFMKQPMMLQLGAPIKICGDIHGQFYDLLRIFKHGGFPPESNYLFLGDYVDRGRQSLETISLLMAYKIRYPENFFLLRGNHECASINKMYGFFDECKRRYSVQLWKIFTDVFNCLPVAAVIDDKIFCTHGGLSPQLTDIEQINNLPRPTDVPATGLLCDLLWSDPEKKLKGWAPSDRGVSFIFGKDVVAKFLNKNDLDLICRAHQVVEDGYEFFASRQLVTLFSAPNYCGEFDNAGGVMTVDEALMCSFQILQPDEEEDEE